MMILPFGYENVSLNCKNFVRTIVDEVCEDIGFKRDLGLGIGYVMEGLGSF
jgi:hypothetical protein